MLSVAADRPGRSTRIIILSQKKPEVKMSGCFCAVGAVIAFFRRMLIQALSFAPGSSGMMVVAPVRSASLHDKMPIHRIRG